MTTPETGNTDDKGLPGPGGVYLDQYELQECLSDSRRGAVYKAKHRVMGRTVAIKFLSEEAARSRQFTERFRRATKILALLEHPNLVRAHEAAEQGNTHYLVMEYIDGKDLHHVLKADGEMPVDQAINYVLQAAAGLAYAHDQGVIHRNIKPGKLVLDGQGVIKIVGFGLAHIDKEGALGQEDDAESLTVQGQVLGSYEYMAPEQAANAKNADQRSDIYSLGCTLHALLTGRPPYPGKGPTMQIVAHGSQPIPSLRKACPDVPEALDRIFAKMLAKQPDGRFASMHDVIREIEPLAGKPAASASKVERTPRLQPSKAAPPPPAATPAPAASPQNKLLLGLGGGALLAVLLFVLIVFVFPDSEPEDQGKPPAGNPREVATVTPPTPKPREGAPVTPPPPRQPEPRPRPTGPRTLENVLANAPPSVPPVKDPPAPKPPAEPSPPPSISTPPPAVPEPKPPVEPAPQPEPPPTPEPEPTPTEPEEPTATADSRRPLPNEQARKRAAQLMQDTFGPEMAEATTPDAKSDFGKRLLTIATEINDDPAGRYVILETVTGLAMDAGDFATGLEAIDTMASSFTIDAWSKKINWLAACADGAKSAEQRRAAATEAFELAKKANEALAFEAADKLCKLATSEGKKAAPFPLIKQIRILDAEVGKRLAAFKAYERAVQKLATDSSDRVANLDAGRYECFLLGNWDTGLAKLAACGDAALQKLAMLELDAPSSPERQIEIADGWRDLADKESGLAAANLHRHAADWYEKSLASATGLLRTKAERRLEESRAAAESES